MLSLAIFLSAILVTNTAQKFSTAGNKIFYGGKWITFNGIGLTLILILLISFCFAHKYTIKTHII